MNSVINALQGLLEEHAFDCVAYAWRSSDAEWLGNKELLDFQSLPRQFFGDEVAIQATFNYLNTVAEPSTMAQGRVRLVLGTIGENMICGFFTNTTDTPSLFYKRAIALRDAIKKIEPHK
jgi:hypothetical protein